MSRAEDPCAVQRRGHQRGSGCYLRQPREQALGGSLTVVNRLKKKLGGRFGGILETLKFECLLYSRWETHQGWKSSSSCSDLDRSHLDQ